MASAGGDREIATIYTDGTVAYAQWLSGIGEGTSYLHKLREDNSGFDTLQKEDFQLSGMQGIQTFKDGRSELDIATSPWKQFTSQTTSEGLDLTAIQNGDYSSLAGTWQNGFGDTFTFDNSGLVMKGEYVNLGAVTIKDGLLITSVSVQPVGGFVIAFIPAGTKTPNGIDGKPDGSDSSKDRLFAGQQPGYSNGKAFYYKVK